MLLSTVVLHHVDVHVAPVGGSVSYVVGVGVSTPSARASGEWPGRSV